MSVENAYKRLCSLVLEDGRRWGDAAEDWQADDALAVLSPGEPRFHFLTRPRGGSKTSDLGGVAIAVLLDQLGRGDRSYGFAADRDQGALLVDAIQGYVDRTPGLGGALRVDAFRVTAKSGATLEILAADEASSWGLKPAFIIVDELSVWKETSGPKRLWRSIFSSLAKRPTSRLVILTMAGDPSHFAYGIMQRAKVRDRRWRVSEIPGPLPWIAADELEEQRAELPEWEYARLHLNEWRTSEDHLATADDIAACVTLDGPCEPRAGRGYIITVDIGLKKDRTAVAITSIGGDARKVRLDRLAVWQGTRANPVQLDEVEAWIVEAWMQYGHPYVFADPYQAAGLLQHLRGRGINASEFVISQSSASKMCVRLLKLIKDHAIELPDDPELIDELEHVKVREPAPGVYRLDHDSSRHDDRAIALAMGVSTLLDIEIVQPAVELTPREFAAHFPPVPQISPF